MKSIKKWGIKLEVAKDTIVYIPTEWSYFYVCKEELLLLKLNVIVFQLGYSIAFVGNKFSILGNKFSFGAKIKSYSIHKDV